MEERRRRGLSGRERSELWRRWKRGQSLSDIGRALGKAPASVHGFLSAKGGIAPIARRRSDRALTVRERRKFRDVFAPVIRCEASRGCSGGRLRRCLAKSRATADDAGTVPRTPRAARGHGPVGQRSANWPSTPAFEVWWPRSLGLDWSPEQIAGWLGRSFPDDIGMRVSHETIYKSLFVQARGVLKRELLRHLRSRRVMRRARTASTAGQERGRIVDAVSIRERPAEVEDRAIPGHWEGDLLSGSHNSHIATLVERTTRFTKLIRVEGKDTASVVAGLLKQVRTLPADLRRTLTWDRGPELAQHARFTVATNVKVYFCDPRSPWQRGTNENTNGLLRQYFPDGTDLSTFTQRDLNEIARRLNRRPRKTLGFLSPAEELQRLLP